MKDARQAAFRGDRVAMGAFRATTSAPWFRDSGPARGHLVVFPRTAVRNTRATSRAMMTNEYKRRAR